MVNLQLVDYIKTQLAQNLTKEQITTSLVATGWQPKDVQAGFSALSPLKPIPLLIISLTTLATISGLSYFGFRYFLTPKPSSSINQVVETKTVDVSSPTPNATSNTTCDLLADNLQSCNPFKCQALHPFTNTFMQKEIVGLVETKCLYRDQMPNNGLMECKFSESTRLAMAKSFQTEFDAMSSGKSMESSLSVDLVTGESQTTHSIDGQVVTDNPLQTALTDGTCVITGYPDPPAL